MQDHFATNLVVREVAFVKRRMIVLEATQKDDPYFVYGLEILPEMKVLTLVTTKHNRIK
jgi:hypothetical protein